MRSNVYITNGSIAIWMPIINEMRMTTMMLLLPDPTTWPIWMLEKAIERGIIISETYTCNYYNLAATTYCVDRKIRLVDTNNSEYEITLKNGVLQAMNVTTNPFPNPYLYISSP